MPKKDLELMGFRETLWYYKAHVWKHLLLQDFINAYRYSVRWVELFYAKPEMITNHPVWFLNGNSYLLDALFLLRKRKRFDYWFKRLETTLQDDFPKNENVQIVSSSVYSRAQLNLLFLKGEYGEAINIIKNIASQQEFLDSKLDDHHRLVLTFKIASSYFGNSDYRNCIAEVDKIIYHKNTSVREDLYFNSRILSAMAKMDSGLDEDLEEFLEETQRFYKRMKKTTAFHKITIDLITDLYGVLDSEKKKIAQKYLDNYAVLRENPCTQRDFVYLDIISWLESIIQNRHISEVIQDKSN